MDDAFFPARYGISGDISSNFAELLLVSRSGSVNWFTGLPLTERHNNYGTWFLRNSRVMNVFGFCLCSFLSSIRVQIIIGLCTMGRLSRELGKFCAIHDEKALRFFLLEKQEVVDSDHVCHVCSRIIGGLFSKLGTGGQKSVVEVCCHCRTMKWLPSLMLAIMLQQPSTLAQQQLARNRSPTKKPMSSVVLDAG